MTQTEFVTKIDSRGSVNIPKSLQEAGYTTGTKVRVILEIVNEQLTPNLIIKGKIDTLFYQGYFEEFLEELEEKEPEIFNEYIKTQSKPREQGEVKS